jgi:hypothetical protein
MENFRARKEKYAREAGKRLLIDEEFANALKSRGVDVDDAGAVDRLTAAVGEHAAYYRRDDDLWHNEAFTLGDEEWEKYVGDATGRYEEWARTAYPGADDRELAGKREEYVSSLQSQRRGAQAGIAAALGPGGEAAARPEAPVPGEEVAVPPPEAPVPEEEVAAPPPEAPEPDGEGDDQPLAEPDNVEAAVAAASGYSPVEAAGSGETLGGPQAESGRTEVFAEVHNPTNRDVETWRIEIQGKRRG